MKKMLVITTVILLFMNDDVIAQNISRQENFHGAEAELVSYKALFIINDGSEIKMKGVLRNIKNALDDPRLKGKLEVELLAFSDGVEIFKKENKLDTLLLELQKKGVLLAQCENTIQERNIDKSTLWSFISYVPSGVGEIIIRQRQGWASVHP